MRILVILLFFISDWIASLLYTSPEIRAVREGNSLLKYKK